MSSFTFNQVSSRVTPYPIFDIKSPRPGETIDGYQIGKYFWGLTTHYNARDTYCDGSRDCPGCQQKLAKRWIGYLPFLRHGSVKPIIIKLTQGAADYLVALRAAGFDPQGRRLFFGRADKRPNSKMTVRHEAKPLVLPRLPDAFNPLYSALHMLTEKNVDLVLQLVREAEAKLLAAERDHQKQYPELYPDTLGDMVG